MENKEALEIKNLLQGKKADKDVIRRLKNGDESLWDTLLNIVKEEDMEIRFSPEVIELLETNTKKWLFLKNYLHRLIGSMKKPETIPLFDLSNFSGYLKFKRQVLHSEWRVDLDSLSTALDCLRLLIGYMESLNAMEKAGTLSTGKLVDELQLLFYALSDGISEEMERIYIRARALGLTK